MIRESKLAKVLSRARRVNMAYFNRMMYPVYLETLPVDNKAILLECQHGLDIDGNIYYLTRELLTNPAYEEYNIYTVGRGREIRDKIRRRFADIDTDRLHILSFRSRKYFKVAATAGTLINDNTFIDFFIKREDQTYLNVWHGTPLKTLGRHDPNTAYRMGNVQKNFFMADYMLFPSEYAKDRMIDAYALENLCRGRVLIGGYPRNEAFFNEELRSRIREDCGFAGKRAYAYLPTWRPASAKDDEKFSENLHEMDRKLNDGELLYVKLHTVVRERFDPDAYERIRIFPPEYETYEFLNAVDVLITDYSSVMFDYAVTGRRTVLFAYDEERYIEKHGTYMALRELPFPVVNNVDALFTALRSEDGGQYDDFREKYCGYDGAEASRLLLDRILIGRDSGFVEGDVPNNGRENILIYAGNMSPNGVTLSFRNLFNRLDRSRYNYYLTFNASSVRYYKDNLDFLPEGVNYIPVVGKMNATLREKFAIIMYGAGHMSFHRFWKYGEKVYRRDFRRTYGDNKFKVSLQFSGYEYKKILGFLLHSGRSVIMVHSDMQREIATRGNQRREVLEYAYRNYDEVIAISEDVRRATLELAGPIDNIAVVNNVADVEGLIKKSREPIEFNRHTRSTVSRRELEGVLWSDSYKFVNVGRFSPEKGQARLIRAFDRYCSEHPDSYLIIIGGNKWKDTYLQLRRLTDSLECRDKVIMILDVDNPFPIVSRCDGFIFSSFYEGFGMALVEAAVLGLPLASTDIEGPRQFLIDSGGLIVENSEEGIYRGLCLLPELKHAHPADLGEYNERIIKLFEAAMDGVALESIEPVLCMGESPWKLDYRLRAEKYAAELAGTAMFEKFLPFVKNLEYRVYLASNYSGKALEYRPAGQGMLRCLGETALGKPERDFYRIRNIEMRGGLLRIEGSVGFYGPRRDEPLTVELDDGSRRYRAETIERNHLREGGGCSMRVVVFSCTVPLAEPKKLKVFVNICGVEIEEKPIYDLYSPLGTKYVNAYYYADGFSVRSAGKELVAKRCNPDMRKVLEAAFLEELDSGGEQAKADAELRRRAAQRLTVKEKPIWLLSDRMGAGGDNSEALFRYIVENRYDEVEAYFVIDGGAADFGRISDYCKAQGRGKTIAYGSPEHLELLLAADAVICSGLYQQFRNPFDSPKPSLSDLLHKPFVLLEHGVSPGKDFHRWMSRSNVMVSLLTVALWEEREQYLAAEYGYSADEIRVTGLPRFDLLHSDPKKRITVMPTWRKSLLGEADPRNGRRKALPGFAESGYAEFWRSLMQNEELRDTAARLGYEIVFLAHPNMRGTEESFAFDEDVKIDRDDRPYSEVLAESDLIVTDYSGVAFDFGYLNKPVVYAQFDRDSLDGNSHTYSDEFDYERKGFGEVELTVSGTAARIIEYMLSGCVMKDEYRKRVDELFAYRDRKNCERVFAAIEECVNRHGV